MSDYFKDRGTFDGEYEILSQDADRKALSAKLRALGKSERDINKAWNAAMAWALCSKPYREAHAWVCEVMSQAVVINLQRLRGSAK